MQNLINYSMFKSINGQRHRTDVSTYTDLLTEHSTSKNSIRVFLNYKEDVRLYMIGD